MREEVYRGRAWRDYKNRHFVGDGVVDNARVGSINGKCPRDLRHPSLNSHYREQQPRHWIRWKRDWIHA